MTVFTTTPRRSRVSLRWHLRPISRRFRCRYPISMCAWAPAVGAAASASAAASAEALVVGCDDGTSVDLAVVQELIGLAGAFQWEVLDEHADLSGLGEFDHFEELGYRAPKR